MLAASASRIRPASERVTHRVSQGLHDASQNGRFPHSIALFSTTSRVCVESVRPRPRCVTHGSAADNRISKNSRGPDPLPAVSPSRIPPASKTVTHRVSQALHDLSQKRFSPLFSIGCTLCARSVGPRPRCVTRAPATALRICQSSTSRDPFPAASPAQIRPPSALVTHRLSQGLQNASQNAHFPRSIPLFSTTSRLCAKSVRPRPRCVTTGPATAHRISENRVFERADSHPAGTLARSDL